MTPRQLLATHLLGRPVLDYIQDLRGTGMSLDKIATQLWDDTGGQVDVTYETIRLWLPKQPKPAEVVCPTCGYTTSRKQKGNG